jgi:hypothetical protein
MRELNVNPKPLVLTLKSLEVLNVLDGYGCYGCDGGHQL